MSEKLTKSKTKTHFDTVIALFHYRQQAKVKVKAKCAVTAVFLTEVSCTPPVVLYVLWSSVRIHGI